jgi:stage II sporulation protein D
MRYGGKHEGRHLLSSSFGGTCAVALLAGAATAMVAEQAPASAAGETHVRPASGIWRVEGRGYGHGRGMAQWGARAAAAAGSSGEQILAFYYPGTVRGAIGNPTIRVRVGPDPNLVVGPASGLKASWSGGSIGLPSSPGVNRWRVLERGRGLGLRYHDARGWHSWGPALPASVEVTASTRTLRVHRHDLTSVDYRGSLVAARSGAGTIVVNRVPLQAYLSGVVPRESPASWPVEALRAQAVAARSYAYARMRRSSSTRYDICDTTACQVYGGAAKYNSAGERIYGAHARTDSAIKSTAGVVLTYAGRPATTEFSASNGGVTVGSSLPYQVAKTDPHVAGDPYRVWTERVRVSDVAAAFGFSRLDYLRVTQRDGHGAYGGRVLSVLLAGRRAGTAYSTTVTGNGLRSALGLRSTYLTLRTG